MRRVMVEPGAGGWRVERGASAPSFELGEALLAPVAVVIESGEAGGDQGARSNEGPGAGGDGSAPRVPGRRFVARLIESRPGGAMDEAVLSRLRRGDGGDGSDRDGAALATASPWTFCGACERCTRGLQAHCTKRRTIGGSDCAGALAERMVLPIRCLSAVPAEVDVEAAAYASLLAEAIHATNQLHLESKAYVTVLGDTPIGLLCAQLMARRNASVRLVGADEGKLELCEKWGVKHRPVDAVGRHGDQDVVVDCTGGGGGLTTALGLVRPLGQVVLRHPWRESSSARADLAVVAEKEVRVLGSRGGQLNDAVRMLHRDEADVVSLMTRRFTLDEAEKARRTAAEPGSISVVVRVGE